MKIETKRIFLRIKAEKLGICVKCLFKENMSGKIYCKKCLKEI